MKYFRQNRMAYAFCTSHFENSKCPVQILYPFGTGKPVPNQNRLSSSPMLSGSLTHATLLLPSEMFNSMPQSLGLEEHPQSAYFTGNVVCWKCSWLYETVDWLRCTLRLINLTLRSTPSINKNVTYKNISVFTSPVRDLSRAWVIDKFLLCISIFCYFIIFFFRVPLIYSNISVNCKIAFFQLTHYRNSSNQEEDVIHLESHPPKFYQKKKKDSE